MKKKSVLTKVKMVMGICSCLFFISLLSGCKEEQKVCTECLHEVYVPLLTSDNTEFPVLSKLYSSIDTVFLENSGPESYIKSVDEVVRIGDTIIVRSSGTLFFFDRSGRFLNSFNRQGRGHGNYRGIDRIDVRPSANELYLLDRENNRVYVYDMNGNFRRQVFIEDYVTDFAVLPDGDFLFTNPIKYSDYRRGLWRTDANGAFREQLVEYDPEFAHVSINNPYLNHISEGVIGFMGVEDNDRFYTYSADTIAVTCRMTTDIVIPDEMKKNSMVFVSPEKEYTKCGYLETPRFLYFVATNYGANLVMVYVDKSNWTTYLMYVYSSDFLENTRNKEPFPFLVGCYNGALVGFYDAGTIIENDFYRKNFPTVNADSNPVLIFYNE